VSGAEVVLPVVTRSVTFIPEAAMTDEEFIGWLDSEVTEGRMLAPQRQDLLKQKGHFDAQRIGILREYSGQIVGFAADERFVSNDLHDLLATIKSKLPGRMLYFEPVGFDLF
jgi:hypothetical protein